MNILFVDFFKWASICYTFWLFIQPLYDSVDLHSPQRYVAIFEADNMHIHHTLPKVDGDRHWNNERHINRMKTSITNCVYFYQHDCPPLVIYKVDFFDWSFLSHAGLVISPRFYVIWIILKYFEIKECTPIVNNFEFVGLNLNI